MSSGAVSAGDGWSRRPASLVDWMSLWCKSVVIETHHCRVGSTLL